MSLTLKKHVYRRDLWIEKMLKIVNALKLTRFCCLFSLRQGTILIGIIELSMTSFCLFLLLLSAAHAQDILALVTSDLQRLEEYNLSEIRIEETLPPYITSNEKKMLIGQHMAFIMMFTFWAGLLLTSIHFISCILLLYGAIRRLSHFLLPWTSTALFSLISGFFVLIMLVFIPLDGCKFAAFVVLVSLYCLELYTWLTVFSYYQELKAGLFKGFGGLIHNIGDEEKQLSNKQSIRNLKLDLPL